MADEKLSFLIEVDDQGTASLRRFRGEVEATGALLDKVKSRFSTFGAKLLEFNAGIELAKKALEGSKSAYDKFIEPTVRAGEELLFLSRRFGSTVAQIASLKNVAEASGVSVESMAFAFRGLNLAVSSLGGANGRQAREVFKTLGLDAKQAADLIRQGPAKAMEELIDRFSEFSDSPDRFQALVKLFGRGAQALNQVINTSKEARDEIKKFKDEFGTNITEVQAKAGEQLNTAFKKIDIAFQNITARLTSADLLKGVTAAVNSTAESLGRFFRSVPQTTIDSLAKSIVAIANAWGALVVAFGHIAVSPLVISGFEALAAVLDRVAQGIDRIKSPGDLLGEAGKLASEHPVASAVAGAAALGAVTLGVGTLSLAITAGVVTFAAGTLAKPLFDAFQKVLYGANPTGSTILSNQQDTADRAALQQIFDPGAGQRAAEAAASQAARDVATARVRRSSESDLFGASFMSQDARLSAEYAAGAAGQFSSAFAPGAMAQHLKDFPRAPNTQGEDKLKELQRQLEELEHPEQRVALEAQKMVESFEKMGMATQIVKETALAIAQLKVDDETAKFFEGLSDKFRTALDPAQQLAIEMRKVDESLKAASPEMQQIGRDLQGAVHGADALAKLGAAIAGLRPSLLAGGASEADLGALAGNLSAQLAPAQSAIGATFSDAQAKIRAFKGDSNSPAFQGLIADAQKAQQAVQVSQALQDGIKTLGSETASATKPFDDLLHTLQLIAETNPKVADSIIPVVANLKDSAAAAALNSKNNEALKASYFSLTGAVGKALDDVLSAVVLGTRKMSDVFDGIKVSLVQSLISAFTAGLKAKLGFDKDFTVNIVGLMKDLGGILQDPNSGIGAQFSDAFAVVGPNGQFESKGGFSEVLGKFLGSGATTAATGVATGSTPLAGTISSSGIALPATSSTLENIGYFGSTSPIAGAGSSAASSAGLLGSSGVTAGLGLFALGALQQNGFKLTPMTGGMLGLSAIRTILPMLANTSLGASLGLNSLATGGPTSQLLAGILGLSAPSTLGSFAGTTAGVLASGGAPVASAAVLGGPAIASSALGPGLGLNAAGNVVQLGAQPLAETGASAASSLSSVISVVGALYSLYSSVTAGMQTNKAFHQATMGDTRANQNFTGLQIGLGTGLTIGGAAIGAGVGSIFPGVGTIVGAAVGAAIGAAISQAITSAVATAVGKGVSKGVQKGLTQSQLQAQVIDRLENNWILTAINPLSKLMGVAGGMSIERAAIESFGLVPNIEDIFDKIYVKMLAKATGGGFYGLNRHGTGQFGLGVSRARTQELSDLRVDSSLETVAHIGTLLTGAGTGNQDRLQRFEYILFNSIAAGNKDSEQAKALIDRIIRGTVNNRFFDAVKILGGNIFGQGSSLTDAGLAQVRANYHNPVIPGMPRSQVVERPGQPDFSTFGPLSMPTQQVVNADVNAAFARTAPGVDFATLREVYQSEITNKGIGPSGQGTVITAKDRKKALKEVANDFSDVFSGDTVQSGINAFASKLSKAVQGAFVDGLAKSAVKNIFGDLAADAFRTVRGALKLVRQEGPTPHNLELVSAAFDKSASQFARALQATAPYIANLKQMFDVGTRFTIQVQLATGDMLGAIGTVNDKIKTEVDTFQQYRSLGTDLETRSNQIIYAGSDFRGAQAEGTRLKEARIDAAMALKTSPLFLGLDALSPALGLHTREDQANFIEKNLGGQSGVLAIQQLYKENKDAALQLGPLLKDFITARLDELEQEVSLARQLRDYYKQVKDTFNGFRDQIDVIRRGPRAGFDQFQRNLGEARTQFALYNSSPLGSEDQQQATDKLAQLVPALLQQGQQFYTSGSAEFSDLLDFLDNISSTVAGVSGTQESLAEKRLNDAKANAMAFDEQMTPVLTFLTSQASADVTTAINNMAALLGSPGDPTIAQLLGNVAARIKGYNVDTLPVTEYTPRASGGPVISGQPYLVGENGPELFVPSTHGSVRPGGGGMTLTVNVGDIDVIVAKNASPDEVADAMEKAIVRKTRPQLIYTLKNALGI